MDQVILWTVVIGSGIFTIGMISAISSRKQSKSERPIRSVASEPARAISQEKTRPSKMDMASVGVSNGEEKFASISGSPR